jgi:phosphoribosylanthranilate isomerase
LAAAWPVILAGGLTPENVAEGVAEVAPLCVDVSGGVETGGIKDAEKIARFAAAAHAAFAMRRGGATA